MSRIDEVVADGDGITGEAADRNGGGDLRR